MPSTVTAFVRRPRAFFQRRRDRLSGPFGAGLAAALSLLMVLVLGVALWLFSQQFTGRVTVDNPAYPGDALCDGGVGGTTPRGCAEPATTTVELRTLLWDEIAGTLPWLFVGLLVVWVGLAVALHVGAKLAGGDGRLGETAEVVAWGLLPTVVGVVLAGGVLVVFAMQSDFSSTTLETILSDVSALQSGGSGLTLLSIQLLTAVWQAVIWAAGLRVAHGITRRAAVVIAVLVAAIPVIFG